MKYHRKVLRKILCQKLENLEEMDTFLERYKLLNQEEKENAYRTITSNKAESPI